MTLLVLALATLLGGGCLSLLTSSAPKVAAWSGAGLAVLGCVLGEVYSLRFLGSAESAPAEMVLPWAIPSGAGRIGVDALSAFFLVPIFGLGAVGAPYGASYLSSRRDPRGIGRAFFAYDLLLASMALVTVARQAVLFLVAWEVMSLSAYFCVTFDQEDEGAARGGWAYLVFSHVGGAALLGLVLLAHGDTGSFDLESLGAVSPVLAPSMTMLAVVGFGIKAGFFPLHVWLPEAHAAAPSHVSAVMSGVLVNTGLYGILRTVTLRPEPVAWIGPVLIGFGLASAVVGIVVATYQRDAKRVLAYSTIENVGLIALALGLAFWGRATGRLDVAALAIAAALLHVWNHSVIKGLLFLATGSVAHGSGTQDLERMGGLLRRMPQTGSLLVVGALAISGLPPWNGFIGEWLLGLALLRGALSSTGAASALSMVAVGILTFVAALAGLAFVRFIGAALLGLPRSEQARAAHESPPGMVLPTAVLGALCAALGMFPRPVLRILSGAAEELVPGSRAAILTRAGPMVGLVAHVHAAIWGLGLLVGAAVFALQRGRIVRGETWSCGYRERNPRMQYTARAFSELLGERLVPRWLRPRITAPRLRGPFPVAAAFSSDCVDPVTRGFYEPLLRAGAERAVRLRWLQRGVTQVYLVYILLALVAGLAWSTFVSWRGAG